MTATHFVSQCSMVVYGVVIWQHFSKKGTRQWSSFLWVAIILFIIAFICPDLDKVYPCLEGLS